MAGIRVRTIAPAERDAVLDLLAGWLDDRAFFARYLDFDPTFRDDLCFVAEADGRLVSTLQVFRKDVRVDGAVLAVGGVGNVYTHPAWRGTGLAGALLERAIAAMATHGFDASLLFASRLDFYARFGWRSVPRQLWYIAPAAAESAPPEAAEVFDAARDLDDVAALYQRHNATVPGATIRDSAYWRGQLRYAGNPDERFLVARSDGRIAAYARLTTLYEFPFVIEHGGDVAMLAGLIAHLHGGPQNTRGSLAQLALDGPLRAALAARGLALRAVDDQSWMWRPIDVERLAARLRLPVAAVRAADLFVQLFPLAGSRYWVADRF